MKIRNLYYLCQDDDDPSGGIHKIYDHVRILNEAGYSAFVLHQTKGFQCSWFKHNVPIAYPKFNLLHYLKIKLKHKDCLNWQKGLIFQHNNIDLPAIREQDVLVIPEYAAHTYEFYTNGLPFVIFNQNSYYTFNSIKLPDKPFNASQNSAPSIYRAKNLLGIMAVSENNLSYLKNVYPDLLMFRIRNSVDPMVFSYSDSKKKWISYMPRKLAQDVKQVFCVLQERNNLGNWMFYPIINQNEIGVAQILKQSSIFLNFIYQEGFSLPTVEAIACGCYVIGYHGQAGQEYLPHEQTIEMGNIISYVLEVERVAKEMELKPDKYLKLTQLQSEKILSIYSQQYESEDVIKAWQGFQNNYGSIY